MFYIFAFQKRITLLETVKCHIKKKFPFLIGKKILVACSGGIDSVVLARILKELKFNISLAHCNFSLRGIESDEDEKFVISIADKLSIPIFNTKFDTKQFKEINKVSTQMAARELRYHLSRNFINFFKLFCVKFCIKNRNR